MFEFLMTVAVVIATIFVLNKNSSKVIMIRSEDRKEHEPEWRG